jgi:hypothetical protein
MRRGRQGLSHGELKGTAVPMGNVMDYYQILGVTPQATLVEIRSAYRRKAKQCHPDMGGTHEWMVSVIAAWEVLSDSSKRALYDQVRSTAADAAAREAWESVREAAVASAAATAQSHGRSWDEFSAWINTKAADVQGNFLGRWASGAVAGSLVGGLLGGIAGPGIGLGMTGGLFVGVTAGSVGGFLAAAWGRFGKAAVEK